MSKRAEERASIAAYGWQSDKDGNMTLEMFPEPFRRGFVKGYEQAEKDLALTWEDMVLLRTLFDATDANQSMGALTVQPMTREYYEYLLREFNEQRKK